ncbi:MAG TPA: ATP-binding protein [Stellaceae bacterium]|nr:ATP-binding protein [Stellaceae bacterium]
MTPFVRRGAAARFPFGIIGLCLAIVAALWVALLVDAARVSQAATSQADHDARNLSMAFREHIRRMIGAVDQLMITVIAENNTAGGTPHIPAWIKDSPLLQGMTVQVAIIGPDGMMIESSVPSSGPIDLSDRPHFRYHLDPSAPQPYVSTPVVGRASGKWSIQITRRIVRPDGRFGGVMVVSLDPLYLAQFFDSVDLGAHGRALLVGRDGIVRARRDLTSDRIGQRLDDPALFAKLEDGADNGSYIGAVEADGMARIYGYAAVANYPLVVSVGFALSDVLAAPERQLHRYYLIGAALSLAIIALGLLLARETQRRRRRELAAHAEALIAEQKALLDTALNTMCHGLVMYGADLRAVVINRRYLEMYGLSPAEAKPGCTARDLLAQRIAAGTFAGDIEQYISMHIPGSEAVFDNPDGRSVRVLNRTLPDGAGWVSTHEDVTARRRAERELQASREMLAWAQRTLGVGSIELDLRTGRVRRTEEFARILGLADDGTDEFDPIGALRAGAHPEDLSAFDAHMADMKAQGHCKPFEFRFMRADDGRQITLREESDIVLDEAGTPIVQITTIRDITAERLASERHRALERHLFHSQKLESLGTLAGGIAHDLNNTLVPILALSQLAMELVPQDSEAREHLATVHEAAQMARDLVKRILAFSRKQEADKRPTDLPALVRDTVRMLRATIPTTIAISDAIADVPSIMGDGGQLQQVIVNLATNAAQAIGESGGKITVSLAHSIDGGADRAILTVSDTGCGMDGATVARVFEPFFTTKGVGEGTGLGLALVHGIVEGHGGTIAVASQPGLGTTFTITLPVVGAAQDSGSAPLAAA